MIVSMIILTLLIAFQNGSEGASDFGNYEVNPIPHPDCPATDDPFNPIQLPVPNDCTMFYKCAAGIAYPLKCPSGLHWSVEDNRCDWPEVAQCEENMIPYLDEPIKTDECPANDDFQHPKHLPNPTDCTKFYKCSHGLAYPMDCPTGQHWSIKLDRCDWPHVAECDPNASEPPTTPTTPSTPSDTTPSSTTPPTSTPSSTTPSTTTPSVTPPSSTTKLPPLNEVCKHSDNTSLLPHPTDCTKFIQCNFGLGYVHECPAGLHFSVAHNNCQYPELAHCQVP